MIRPIMLLLLLILWSCKDPKGEAHSDNQVLSEYSTSEYISSSLKENFVLINIDSLANFSELNKRISQTKCDNKIPGLTFSITQSHYNLVGCSDCRLTRSLSCKRASSFVFIKNDSIVMDLSSKRKIHISQLGEILEDIDNGRYRYRTESNLDSPIVINFNVDDSFPISVTKNVLKEIIIRLEQTEQLLKIKKYNYEIHFGNYEIL